MTGFFHELFPYIVAVYLVESLLWVRAGQVAFVRRGRGPFRRVGPGVHLAGAAPFDQIVVVPAAPAKGSAPDGDADRAAVSARREVHAQADRRLVALSIAAFAAGFVALPLAVYKADPLAAAVHAVVGLLAVLWLAVAVIAERGLARAGVSRRDRAVALSPLLFFPPSAAHAPSFVWRDVYAGFPPEVVAAELGVRTNAFDGRLDPGAEALCPSCGVQYRAGFTRCSDCDVGLVSLASPDEARAIGDGARCKT